MSEKIEIIMETLHNKIDELSLNPVDYGIFDDEDMTAFALRYLLDNAADAFKTG